jgi:capsular polysaccharide export protein
MIHRAFRGLQGYQRAWHARRFLAENLARRRHAPLDIKQLFPSGGTPRRILLLVEREELYGRAFFLESLGAQIVRGIPPRTQPNDVAICFGYMALERYAARLRASSVTNLLFIEAGFLRSVVLDNSSSIYDQAICFFVDDLGFHFDPGSPTRLECLLNDPHLNPTAVELERARALQAQITQARLTKYNDQPMTVPLGPKRFRRVLVVEQARNDWAVLKSGGNRRSFESILQTAIDENPDAEILVKVHPDSLDGKRGGLRRSYFGRLQGSGRVVIVREKVNPFALLESIDTVYVFSSMLGFEAALIGKEVHVFGKPCYSGWGFTRDRQAVPRRARHRSLDEVVYFLYFAYQHYKNLEGEWCRPENAVDIIIKLREQYMLEVLAENRCPDGTKITI